MPWEGPNSRGGLTQVMLPPFSQYVSPDATVIGGIPRRLGAPLRCPAQPSELGKYRAATLATGGICALRQCTSVIHATFARAFLLAFAGASARAFLQMHRAPARAVLARVAPPSLRPPKPCTGARRSIRLRREEALRAAVLARCRSLRRAEATRRSVPVPAVSRGARCAARKARGPAGPRAAVGAGGEIRVAVISWIPIGHLTPFTSFTS